MANLSLSFLLDHAGEHRLAWPVQPGPVFTSITNDSRVAKPGALFVALEAERDGHDFIADAKAKGAIGALARREVGLDADPSFAYVLVDDPLTALQRVATAHLAELDVGVVGITGSVGKTSAKEAIAQVLRRRHNVLASPGNFNNEIGLPIAVLDLTPAHDRAVLEMGAYREGEIAQLCRIAPPQVGVVTTVGPTHLESFGSIEAIERGKGELIEALPETGLAVLNGDDERVRHMASRAGCPVVLYGTGPGNTLRASEIETRGLDGIAFTLEHPLGDTRVTSPLIGRHSVYACLAAAAVALADDFDPAEIAAALAEQPTRLRLKPLPGHNGSTVLDDSYNSAPISALAALDVLAEHEGRRVAVLGDMLELGEVEEEAHRRVGRRAATAADVLVAVGPRARMIGEEAERAGLKDVRYFPSAPEASFEPKRGDLVLVKGSRGVRLEQVVAKLVAPEAAAAVAH